MVNKYLLMCFLIGRNVFGGVLVFSSIAKLLSDNNPEWVFIGEQVFVIPKLLLVISEFILGSWFLFLAANPKIVLIGFIKFGLFFIYSFQIYLLNISTCGCFGIFSVDVFWMCVLDFFAAIFCLRSLVFEFKIIKTWKLHFKWLDVLAMVFLVGLVCSILIGSNYYSATQSLLAFGGKKHRFNPNLIQFGKGAPGDSVRGNVLVENRGSTRLRLLGGTNDCNCTLIGDFPIDLREGETTEFEVVFRIPELAEKGQILKRSIFIYGAHEFTQPYFFGCFVRVQ